MQSRQVVLIATLLAGASALAAPDLPTYAVTDLKALGIWPVAMNNRGQVLGTGDPLDTTYTTPVRSFLYSAGNVKELFPPTDTPNRTWPLLLGDGGHVVFEGEPVNSGQRSSIWIYDGKTYRQLEPPPPEAPEDVFVGWRPDDVNAAGQVVGSVSYQKPLPAPYGSRVSWAWVDDHGALRNVKPPGEQRCSPVQWNALNAGGDVALQCEPGVGVMYNDGTWRKIDDRYVAISDFNDARVGIVSGMAFGVPTYAFGDAGTQLIEPICPEGSSYCQTWGAALNERGEVVGGSNFIAWVGSANRSLSRALVWRDGNTTDVHPAGDFSSWLTAINESGVAVGTHEPQDRVPRPWVYASGTSLDISELRGVGAALDAALAESTSPVVQIADSGHILVAASWVSYSNPYQIVVIRRGAYLLSPVVPTVSLSVDTSHTGVGRPVTLTWNSTDANSCAASGGVPGDGWAGVRPTSGQITVTSSTRSSVEYSIRCHAGPVFGDAKVAVSYAKKSGGGGHFDGLAATLLGLGLVGLGLSRRRKAN